ncbi:glycosyltransferase [Nocardioides baculatus]|uniref:Glycosyltransferase family 1 protein n=1 Tax=Nocardioides baculatus TaxID=2801337 RepID=A0ABS1LD14_9ACTN|nr:glycosyltransferase [Nocardioides baculatus]MBL0749423.1 glycosyltransferase family 1 protein [Nocardioides baculatus]
MRILCTFVGGLGHLTPLLPLARAAQAAGHEVSVAGSGGLVPAIEAAGFPAFATSPRPHHSGAPAERDRTPLEVTDARAAEVEFAANFASRGARRMAAAVADLLEEQRPDLVLRDETDLGSTIAAELHGVPVATHLVLASGLLVRPELVAPELDAVRAEHGLAPDPSLARLTTGLVLSDFPPGFRSPDAPLTVHPLHYRSAERVRGRRTTTRPTVYATLGTIFNKTSGDLFERLVDGLGGLDADVVVTIGRELDPADLGPRPAHVRIERFVPQDELLAGADLVVSHGGSGSLMAALAHGLPSVLLPLGADQPHNARRAGELGLASTLDAATATPDEIRDAAQAALADDAMARRCRQVAAELASLPSVGTAVAALEEAASGTRP